MFLLYSSYHYPNFFACATATFESTTYYIMVHGRNTKHMGGYTRYFDTEASYRMDIEVGQAEEAEFWSRYA